MLRVIICTLLGFVIGGLVGEWAVSTWFPGAGWGAVVGLLVGLGADPTDAFDLDD